MGLVERRLPKTCIFVGYEALRLHSVMIFVIFSSDICVLGDFISRAAIRNNTTITCSIEQRVITVK